MHRLVALAALDPDAVRAELQRVLDVTPMAEAAAALGISRSTLARVCKRVGVVVRQGRRPSPSRRPDPDRRGWEP